MTITARTAPTSDRERWLAGVESKSYVRSWQPTESAIRSIFDLTNPGDASESSASHATGSSSVEQPGR
jgi:hypothetical protein